MKIGGLEKFSMIDYPGRLSAVIFTKGCNFRCPFCYNPLLVEYNGSLPGGKEKKGHTLSEDDLFNFLKSRQGKLDSVVISGGEPTMQADLPEFIKKIKALGFLVKLDTNGSNPEILKKIFSAKIVDYVAMDIKADEKNYARAIGSRINLDKVKESVKMIMDSLPAGRQVAVPYEFRTTCVPGFLDEKILENIGKIIEGAEKWYLQNFKSDSDMIDKSLTGKSGFTDKQMAGFTKIGRQYVKVCEAR